MGLYQHDGRVSRGIRVMKPLSEIGGAAATSVKQSAQAVRQAGRAAAGPRDGPYHCRLPHPGARL